MTRATTAAAHRCTHCAAHVTSESARYCAYCGTVLPIAPSASHPGSPSPLAALANREDVRALLDAPGTTKVVGCQRSWFRWIVSVVILAGLAFVLVTMFSGEPGVGLGVATGVLLILVTSGLRARSRLNRAAANERRFVARVSGKRTDVTGRRRRTRTWYYATLENAAGERREVHANDRLYARISVGDVGVAALHGDLLADLTRISV